MPFAAFSGGKSKSEISSILCVLVAVTACAIAFCRLFFGVDFTDESFYVALPYRFVLGDLPFIDEHNLTQTTALMTVPLVRLWVFVVGDATGIILFTRFCYWLFTVMTAAVVFCVLKRGVSWRLALVASTLPIVFLPLAIPNFSYNTLGAGFLSLGVLAFINGIEGKSHWGWSVLAGLCHGLAVQAYQPLAIACTVGAVSAVFIGNQRRRYLLFYAVTALAVVLVFAVTSGLTVEIYRGMIQNVTSVNQGFVGEGAFGWSKARRVVTELACGVHTGFLLGAISLVWVGRSEISRLGRIAVPVRLGCYFLAWGLIFLGLRVRFGGLSTHGAVIYSSLAGMVLLLWGKPSSVWRGRFFVVAVPLVIGALTMAYYSSNGARNFAFAAVVLASFSVVRISEWFGAAASFDVEWNWILAVPVLLMCVYGHRDFYKEDFFYRLTERVEFGPFRGLYTSPEKKEFLVALQDDLSKIPEKNGRILFFPFFSAGYLMTGLRPAARTVWTSSDGFSDPAHLTYFIERQNEVVQICELQALRVSDVETFASDLSKPLALYYQAHFTRYLSRPTYRLYHRSP